VKWNAVTKASGGVVRPEEVVERYEQ